MAEAIAIRAVQILQKAIDEHNNKNNENCLRLYREGVKLMNQLPSHQRRTEVEETLQDRLIGAHILRAFLAQRLAGADISDDPDRALDADCTGDVNSGSTTATASEAALLAANKAMILFALAVGEDKKKNQKETLRLYREGVKELDGPWRENLPSTLQIFSKRARLLRAHLEQRLSAGADESRDSDGGGGGNNGVTLSLDIIIMNMAATLFTEAVAEDKGHNYEAALALYNEGVAELDRLPMQAYGESIRDNILNRRQTYVARAHRIRAYLDNPKSEIDQFFGGDEEVSVPGQKETAVPEAVNILVRAVEADKGHNYHEAVRLYDEGLGLFELLQVQCDNERVREKIREKIREKSQLYADRANRIRAYLTNQSNADADESRNADGSRNNVINQSGDAAYADESQNADAIGRDSDDYVKFCNLFCCSFFLTKKKSKLFNK